MERERELAGWPEFAAGHLPPKTMSDRRLVLFHARWKLAWCFQELAAPGFSDKVRDGYSAAFKVFLAYTAHEQLADAVGVVHHELPLQGDPRLAADIRRHLLGLRESVDGEARGRKQQDGLLAFWDAKTDDVRFFAYGLRNVVAHGPFTASKLRSKRSLEVLVRLAEFMLLADEQWFGDWVDISRAADRTVSRIAPGDGAHRIGREAKGTYRAD
jgi:hypothetical protein